MSSSALPFTIQGAPMMGHSDYCFRSFLRFVAPACNLTTEMVPLEAIIRGAHLPQMYHDVTQQPLTLQIGGRSLESLDALAPLLARCNFSEININAGCPSRAVRSGAFGIALFSQPTHLAMMVARLKKIAPYRVSVKTRIGVDSFDTEKLHRLIAELVKEGLDKLVIHARVALLAGVSPKHNRSIPPLQYEAVAGLKSAFPNLPIVINGGITSRKQAQQFLSRGYQGIMIGRAFVKNPLFARTLQEACSDKTLPPLDQALMRYLSFGETIVPRREVPIRSFIKPLLALCSRFQGASLLRRALTTPDLSFDKTARIIEQIKSELTDKPDSV